MNKPYQEMNQDQLREATSRYDKPSEGGGLPGKTLTPAERKRWDHLQDRMQHQARTKGRPKVGEGVTIISLSVEQGLLRRADALAKRRGISRAAVVAE